MHKSDKLYLLSTDVTSLIHDLQIKETKYTVFFTNIKLCKEVKYTKSQKHYHKTVKSGVGYAQSTYTKRISKIDFQKAQKKRIAKALDIDKYKIHIEGHTHFIYRYKSDLSGLFILSIPFKFHDTCKSIVTSSILTPYIEKEVTEDPRYENKHLALLGNPSKHPYNIYAIFKDIEFSRIKNIDDILYKEMKTSDAVRIKLFSLFHLMNQHRKMLEDNPNSSKHLKKFRKVLKETKLILSEYDTIFEEEVFQKIYQHIIMMINMTKTQKDLFLIRKKFVQTNKELNNHYITQLINNLEFKIEAENSKISKFFNTRQFAIIHRQYELFLKENNRSYLTYDAQISIAYSAKLKIKSTYTHLLKSSDKYDGCNDDKSYDKLRQEFSQLYKFIQIFAHVIERKDRAPLVEHLQKINSLLKKHQKQSKSLLISTMIMDQVKNLTPAQTKELVVRKDKLKHTQKSFDKDIAAALNIFLHTPMEILKKP